jgi:hypothetical protein
VWLVRRDMESEVSKNTGIGRGAPGVLKSSRPRTKPCAICGEVMRLRFPSDADRVRVHKRCQGLWQTRRAAFNRLDTLEPRLALLTLRERRCWLEGYRLGSQHTFKRYTSRTLRAAKRERAA